MNYNCTFIDSKFLNYLFNVQKEVYFYGLCLGLYSFVQYVDILHALYDPGLRLAEKSSSGKIFVC